MLLFHSILKSADWHYR